MLRFPIFLPALFVGSTFTTVTHGRTATAQDHVSHNQIAPLGKVLLPGFDFVAHSKSFFSLSTVATIVSGEVIPSNRLIALI